MALAGRQLDRQLLGLVLELLQHGAAVLDDGDDDVRIAVSVGGERDVIFFGHFAKAADDLLGKVLRQADHAGAGAVVEARAAARCAGRSRE